jgi:hypothetical protein
MLHVVGEEGREQAEKDSDRREEWAGDADTAGKKGRAGERCVSYTIAAAIK